VQLVSLFDAAVNRRRRLRSVEFEQIVEGTRAGTILAHDKRAYQRWRSQSTARSGRPQRGLTGAALESAVMRVAQMFPGNVIAAA
jgi:hypothetical protein